MSNVDLNGEAIMLARSYFKEVGIEAAFFDDVSGLACREILRNRDAIRELLHALTIAEKQMTLEDMLLPEEPSLRSALHIAREAIKKHGNGESVQLNGEKAHAGTDKRPSTNGHD